ncbi:MAG: type I-MYXAN CRISPR-associated endonuclease Cas1 [Acidobacteria bacterium]|nr:type I-MYXAN CRISPR-associated endonuclease Cas1 [Acidobacteriota bacterium]
MLAADNLQTNQTNQTNLNNSNELANLNKTNFAVHALHALAYCERLFYLENVEQLRLADAAVYAGRRLHAEIEKEEDGDEWISLTLENNELQLVGKVDCVRRRDGKIIPYEHKRGYSARSIAGTATTWPSDRLQIIAYAVLVEAHIGKPVFEGRVRYHADKTMVRVNIDDQAREELKQAVARAQELQNNLERPPVTSNERLCIRCSLAPICLPEETRLGNIISKTAKSDLVDESIERKTLRLFPADDDRQSLHIIAQGARIGRKGDRLEISAPDEPSQVYPVQEVGQVVLHGFSQITTQALRFCAQQEIGVHWVTTGGNYIGSLSTGSGSVQRRVRQYRALSDKDFCLKMSKQLVDARARTQLSFLLRASRDSGRSEPSMIDSIKTIRKLLSPLSQSESIDSLRGYEGSIGACYFSALPYLIVPEAGQEMRPNGRSRRPPKDRCNALLSFGYALLLKDIVNAILVVGLEPSLGFYHQPRSQAQPLALDLMELFRVPIVDIAVVASINRKQWSNEDFQITGEQVWLSDSGRKKLISIYEKRKSDQWKHPVIGHSLTYSRLMELEVRLLEKEWMGEGGLFAKMRLR